MPSIDVKPKGIKEIFKDSTLFEVEFFQRRYDWDSNTILDLLNELEEEIQKNVRQKPQREYFLGNIILKKKDNSFSIVDGQQRITTLFLILKNLELRFLNLDGKKWKSKIQEIKSVYSTENNSRIKIRKVNNKIELNDLLIRGQISDETNKKIENFYYKNQFEAIEKWVNENLKSESDLSYFYSKILSIVFSVVQLDEGMNEYKVFEDFNSKGKSLSIEDLLRNYYSKMFHSTIESEFGSKSPIERENFLKDSIEKFEFIIKKIELFLGDEKKKGKNLFSKKINRWFKSYLYFKILNNGRSKFQISEENELRLYKEYKNAVDFSFKRKSNVDDEVKEIEKYFKFCQNMDSGFDCPDVVERNNFLLVNEINFYPILYFFYKEFYSKNDSREFKTLCQLITFLYLFSLSNNNDLKDINKNHFLKIKEIFNLDYDGENFNLFRDKIKEYLLKEIIGFDSDSLEQVNDYFTGNILNLANYDLYNNKNFKKLFRFIFNFYENKKFNKEIVFLGKNEKGRIEYTIEHIIPISNENNKNLNSIEKEIKFFSLHKPINLVYLEDTLNKFIGNDGYSEKRKNILNLLEGQQQMGTKINSTREIFEFSDKISEEWKKNKIKNFEEIASYFCNENILK